MLLITIRRRALGVVDLCCKQNDEMFMKDAERGLAIVTRVASKAWRQR
jgi:hypothetical protein